MKVEVQWGPEQWDTNISLVRSWNDQAENTIKKMITDNDPETTEAKIALVAESFMQSRNDEASLVDGVVWLAIQAAVLIVEKVTS